MLESSESYKEAKVKVTDHLANVQVRTSEGVA